MALSDTRPDFRAAQQADSEVAPQPQGVALRGHAAAVGSSRFGVIEMAAPGMLWVGLREPEADTQSAQGAAAQFLIGIVQVGARMVAGRQRDDVQAQTLRAVSNLDDGARRFLPIAAHARFLGACGETQWERRRCCAQPAEELATSC